MIDGWDPGFVLGGRFVLRHVLASSGASSIVYLSDDQDLEKRVAIKALRPEYAQDPKHIERFLRESRVLARVNSPHIITVIARGIEGGVYWYAMEYFARSDTLRHFIDKFVDMSGAPGLVPIAIVHRIAIELMRALYALSPDAHRDIKPSNILITRTNLLSAAMSEDPEDYHLILLDFGTVRGRQDPPLTRTGEACGTESYIAPETYQNNRNTDHRVDLYSWACVISEVLAGGRLAPGFKAANLLRYRSAAEVKPWIPLLERQLSHSPEERADAREVLAILETIRPTSSSAETAEATSRPVPRRRWAAVATVLALVVILCGFYGLGFTGALESFRDRDTTETATGAVKAQETTPSETEDPQTEPEPASKNTEDAKKQKPYKKMASKKQTRKQKMVVYDVFGEEIRLPEGEQLRVHIE